MAENVILAEQKTDVFTLTDTGYITSQTGWFSLTAGETYRVRWDEDEYTCTAYSFSQSGYDCIFLGNESLIKSESTNVIEPFVIYQVLANNYCVLVSTTDTEAKTHTVAIYKVTEAQKVIVLKDRNGADVQYPGVDIIRVNTVDGGTQGFASFDPDTLVPGNIAKGVTIGGIVGTMDGGAETRIEYTLDASGNIIGATPYNFTEFPDYAFSYLKSLKWVDFSHCPNLTSLPRYCFYYCESLTEFAVPDQITNIGEYAFSRCGLTEFTIPDQITNIRDSLLSYCPLESITIPDHVQTLGAAFFNCTALKNVVIGSGVTKITKSCFSGCSALTSVTFKDTSGWYVSTSGTATSGTSLSSTSLANKTTAATYLTDTYKNYYWFDNT